MTDEIDYLMGLFRKFRSRKLSPVEERLLAEGCAEQKRITGRQWRTFWSWGRKVQAINGQFNDADAQKYTMASEFLPAFQPYTEDKNSLWVGYAENFAYFYVLTLDKQATPPVVNITFFELVRSGKDWDFRPSKAMGLDQAFPSTLIGSESHSGVGEDRDL